MLFRADSKYVLAYNNRGVLKQQMGDLHGALADFDQAIKHNPRHAQAYANRGFARLLLGKKADAERDFARSLTRNPSLRSLIQNRTAGISPQ